MFIMTESMVVDLAGAGAWIHSGPGSKDIFLYSFEHRNSTSMHIIRDSIYYIVLMGSNYFIIMIALTWINLYAASMFPISLKSYLSDLRLKWHPGSPFKWWVVPLHELKHAI